MSTRTPQSHLLSDLDSAEVKDARGEDLSDLRDVMTDPWVERDCLCGTFTARDTSFSTPANAIKSRW
jgi:hypothetical protein